MRISLFFVVLFISLNVFSNRALYPTAFRTLSKISQLAKGTSSAGALAPLVSEHATDSLVIAGVYDQATNGNFELSGFSGAGLGLLFGGIAGVLASYIFAWKAEQHRSTAFDIYDSMLLRRLELKSTSSTSSLLPTNKLTNK